MRFVLSAAFVAAVLLTFATGAQAERVFPVTGVVRAPLENGRLVVSHDEIVGYMPAMTMGFEVAASATPQARRLRDGDRIAFSLHVDETRSAADGFRVLADATAPATVVRSSPVRRLHVGDSIPEFSLVDERNQSLSGSDLKGHLTLLTFVFTRCPVPEYCPLVSRRFAEFQQAILADPDLADRVRLLSITLDPEFDRPEVLSSYGQALGANAAIWHFATGTPEAVRILVRAFSVYTERNGALLDHTLCTALIDRDGRVVDLWRGNGWKVVEVLEALRNAR